MLYNRSKPLFQMTWVVNTKGYKVEGPTLGVPKLSRSILTGPGSSNFRAIAALVPRSQKWREYDPFEKEHLGAAREFSNISIRKGKLDTDEALNFANKYGLLGLGLQDGKQEESLDDWLEKVKRFKAVFDELDDGNGQFAHVAFNHMGIMPRMNLSISPGWAKHDLSLEMTPATLYGALWIMTANEITRGVEMTPCERPGCHNWFLKRTNRRFCGDYCRVAENRRAKRQV